MDVLAALSRAADVTRPGARDQLPVASVVLTVAALVAAGAPQHVPSVGRLVSAVKGLGVIGFTVLVLGVVAASILLQPLLAYIGDVLSGGQGARWLRWLMLWMRTHHQRRFLSLLNQQGQADKALDDLEEKRFQEQSVKDWDAEIRASFRLDDMRTRAAVALRRYPEDPRLVMPTLLGNVLRAGEINAGGRYGLDTLTVFPRLDPLLPDETEKRVARSRDDLRFAVQLASALIVAATVSMLLLLPIVTSPQMGWRDVIWFAVPTGSALLAWASYRNAIFAAIQYGEALAVAFDLSRFALYDALRVQSPHSQEAERELANRITAALAEGDVVSLQYTPPPAVNPKD